MSGTLYRCFGEDGSLLYVGASINAAQRLTTHKSSTPWWTDVTVVSLEHHDTIEDATLAELRAIEAEAPTHNRQRGRVITEDDLIARRERKRQRDEKFAEEKRKREEFERTCYLADVTCTNCGRDGELRFPRGVAVEDAPCRLCGVAAYQRKGLAS